MLVLHMKSGTWHFLFLAASFSFSCRLWHKRKEEARTAMVSIRLTTPVDVSSLAEFVGEIRVCQTPNGS